MQRRTFLASGVAAMAAVRAAGQQGGPAAAAPKAKITSSVMLWTLKGSLDEKLAAAARAGMQSVEMVGEYAGWTDAEVARVKSRCASFGLGIDTLIASPDWGRRQVSMLDPAQHAAFLADVKQAIGYARKLEVPQIILMSGNEIAGRTRESQYAALVEATKRAGDLAGAAGVTLIVEPLNAKVDHKGYFLTTCSEGLKLVKEVGVPHVRLLFDIYHEQVQTGSVLPLLSEAAPYVAVFHVADAPGRHEPSSGEIKWRDVYRAIQKSGFGGYVAMEYKPQGEQVASLIQAVNEFRAGVAAPAAGSASSGV